MFTRKQFIVGGLTATTSLLLEGCGSEDDDGRGESFDAVGDTLGSSGGNTDATTESTTDTTTETTTDTTTETTTDTTSETTTETTTDTTESTTDTTESTTDTTETTTDTTDTTETGDPVCPQGASGTILENHGHVLLISQADILAAVPKVYNIQGGANHNHTVSLTAADFAQLALGNQVDKTSSFLQAHSHMVLIACLL